MPLRDFLAGPAVALLYPFVREAFANLTLRGRFGPVWLNPFNVRAMAEGLPDTIPPDNVSPPARSDAPGPSPDAAESKARR